MTEGPFLIETTALNTLVHPNSNVYVCFGQNQYVRKKARDLQEGDLVVVTVESIDKKPEDVYAVLGQQSLRYALAEQFLFEQNNHGHNIPRLRTGILRGLTDPEIPNRTVKILKDGDDFDEATYNVIADTLEGIVNVSRKTIRNNWLTGDVIAPEDWTNFAALSAIGSTEGAAFQGIYDSYNQPLGFHAAYKLYVGLRSAVMSYLARRGSSGGNGKGQSSTSHSPKGIFSPEIEAVVHTFFSEIDQDRIAARITKIHPFSDGNTNHEKQQRPEPRLFKGLINDDSLPCLRMREVYEVWYLLGIGFNELIQRQDDIYANLLRARYSFEDQKIFDKHILPRTQIIIPARVVVHPYYREILKLTSPPEIDPVTIERMFDDLGKQFYNDLKEGIVDRRFGFKPGTVSTLIDTLSQYSSLLPSAHFEIMINKYKRINLERQLEDDKALVRKDRRALQAEVDRFYQREDQLRHYLHREYGGKEKFLFFRYHAGKYIEKGKYYGTVVDPALTDSALLSEAREKYEAQGTQFFEYVEVRSCLQKLGFGCIVPYYDPTNFRH